MGEPNSLESDCLFCRWINEKEPVESKGTVTAFNDGFPVTEGHLLIMPQRHVADGFLMSEQEILDSKTLIRTLSKRIGNRDPKVTGFNVGMNIGKSAGQTVFHAHIHLIPRRDGDCDNPKGGVRGVIDGKRIY